MNLTDAQKLTDLVNDTYGDGAARIHQVGNLEWVCRIRKRDYWLWDYWDWEHYRRAKKGARKAQAARERIVV
jgi:hypothetical protein